jgi:hypothetical protein
MMRSGCTRWHEAATYCSVSITVCTAGCLNMVQAEAAAKSCDEPAAAAQAPAPPADVQAAQLVEQYKQWRSKHGDAPPAAGGWQQQSRQPPVRLFA